MTFRIDMVAVLRCCLWLLHCVTVLSSVQLRHMHAFAAASGLFTCALILTLILLQNPP